MKATDLRQKWLARRDDPLLARCSISLGDVAAELLADLDAVESDSVTLRDAHAIGGYSPNSLGRLIRQGRLENVGRKNAPRIRRRDVPIKPGHVAARDEADVQRIPATENGESLLSSTELTRTLRAVHRRSSVGRRAS